MSVALLKKSLELVDTPYERKEVKEDRGKPFKYTLVKPVEKAKGKKKTQRGVADFRKKNRNTIEQVKKNLKNSKDQARQNSKKLKLLKKPVLDKNNIEIILQRFGRSLPEKKPEIKEETTAFTEEDFKRFEREYIDS